MATPQQESENNAVELNTSNASFEAPQETSSDSDSDSDEEKDNIEDEELSEYEAKTSPYHLMGFCCFCSSIIVGITCVLVSTLLESHDAASNIQLKFIWGALFGAFIVFLFLCLCCTYYLGASKESWEIPAFSGIRKNFTNFVALAGLVIEFIQITSFSFNRTRLFAGYDLSNANYIAVPVGDNVYFFTTVYWLMFVVAFTPYIFVIIIRVIIYVYTMKKGESAAANLVERFQEKIHSVLWFLVNALYFPVIGTMIAGTDCTFNQEEITLDAEQSIHCLTKEHIGILISSMIALVIYYPAASFAQAQTQSISDIKFKPRIVFIMLQGKFLIVLISLYWTSDYYIYYSGLFVINIIFLVLNIVARPCLVGWVNRMRTIFFSMTLWATICAGIIATWIMNDEESMVPLAILLVGWVLVVASLLAFFTFWSKWRQNSKEVVV